MKWRVVDPRARELDARLKVLNDWITAEAGTHPVVASSLERINDAARTAARVAGWIVPEGGNDAR